MADGSLRCPRCGGAAAKPVASMTGSIMGDEETESYYFCGPCQVYFIEYFRDSFTLGESARQSKELPKTVGDARIALVRRCETPWDKTCRCEAHKEYFGGWLD
jgi:hypothetical protein